MITSQSTPATAMRRVRGELFRKSIKNTPTRTALIAAMSSAMNVLAAPQCQRDAITLIASSTNSAIRLRTSVATEAGCACVVIGSSHQVKQRKEKDPHHVHKVPVQADHL